MDKSKGALHFNHKNMQNKKRLINQCMNYTLQDNINVQQGWQGWQVILKKGFVTLQLITLIHMMIWTLLSLKWPILFLNKSQRIRAEIIIKFILMKRILFILIKEEKYH